MTDKRHESQVQTERTHHTGATPVHESPKGGAVAEADAPSQHPAKDGAEVNPLALPPFPAQNDIFPRPPLELTNFLDLSTAAYDQAPGLPGTWVDTGVHDQISRIPESDIPFAAVVVEGSVNGMCKASVTGAERVLGLAVLDFTAGDIDPTTGNVGTYKAHKGSVGIARKGRVWVMADAAVTRGTPVKFGAGGVISAAGAFTLAGAFYHTDAQANQMAIVELNLSN